MVGQILKQRHRIAILAWAHARRRWRLHTWQHILFSNESRFSLRFSDGRYRVNRRRGERFTDQCVYTRPTVLEAEVLWSGICLDGLHSAQNCSKNIECRKIQGRHSWSYSSALSATAKLWARLSIWQCKMSRARVCQDFLNQNHIRALPGPVLSPDLSPIEHLWNELGRCVCHRHNPPETLHELHDALVHE